MALTTVNSDGVKDDSIKNIDVKSDAAIAGTKIAPDFGSQDITSSGKINIGSSTHTTRKLAIHDTTNAAIVIEGASNGSSSILLADENDEDVGFISYNHATDDLSLTAADNIILTSGAGAKLQIRDGNTTGNVKFNAVNSAENANVSLEIAATDTLFFNGGTERLRIDSNGRILIADAATAANTPMEVFGSAVLQLATTAGGSIILGRNDTSVATDNNIGVIQWDCNDSTGNAWNDVAKIACSADGGHADGDYPTRLGFFTTADGAATLTERLRITSGGKVGIGTTSPIVSLDVNGEIALPQNHTIRWHDGGSTRVDMYGDSSNNFIIRNNSGNAIATLSNYGHLTLPGNLVVAEGKGIDFSAQTASSATDASIGSEILDHYEEGAWTPKVRGSTTAGTASATTANGKYTRIGDIVTLQVYMSYTHTGGSGYWEIYDLPFASKAGQYSSGAVFIKRMNIDDNVKNNVLYIGSASSILTLYGTRDDDVWVRQEVDSTTGSNEQGIIGGITYKVDT